jgi:prepilin-type processing-associated H-X9-DG protein/prepilin-type N-terminal cleavage/methylation domain-containing protein
MKFSANIKGVMPRCCCIKAEKLSQAFTVVELLVVVAIIAILAALLLPALARAKVAARKTQCSNNLHQLSLATEMYWEDHEEFSFVYKVGFTNGGQTYWFGWLKPGAEGQRDFDPTLGALYPYIGERGPEICPSFDYTSGSYKYKARGAAYGYGYNLFLGEKSLSMERVSHPDQIALFADAGQINDFQSPASPDNPMLEEFYYIDDSSDYPNVHFRHSQRANVAFCDGHVGSQAAVSGSFDSRLPNQFVGRLPAELLKF